MNRTPITSKLLKSYAWEASKEFPNEIGTLEIEFPKKTGSSVYQYTGVPLKLWEEFQKAESKGKFFLAHVKAKFPFTKIEEPPPAAV